MPKLKSNAFRKVAKLFEKTDRALDISVSDYEEGTPVDVSKVQKLYQQSLKKQRTMRVVDLSSSGGWVLEIDMPDKYHQYLLYFQEAN